MLQQFGAIKRWFNVTDSQTVFGIYRDIMVLILEEYLMKRVAIFLSFLLCLDFTANAQDRIILCNDACEARKAKQLEDESRKLANTDAKFLDEYSFGTAELNNDLFLKNEDNSKRIESYGFIDLNDSTFNKNRMRLGAKRKAIAACRKVHQVRLAADGVEPYRVNAGVDFDDSKTNCTKNSCSVSGDCSFLGLGQFSRPRIWTNSIFDIHTNGKPSLKERNMASEFNLPSTKSCQILDSIYEEGKENWLGSSKDILRQTYYKSAIALCE